MATPFWDAETGQLAVRLCVALACGAALGIERQWRGRQAGLRTNLLVCVGAAIFTYLSATAFGTTTERPVVAAQVVTGIGFIGAGVVLRRGESVQGLNTAATLWTGAAIGMAAGAGAFDVALLGTAGILWVQVLFRPVAGWVDQRAVRNVPRFRYWLTVIVDAPAAREVQDVVLASLDDRPVERVSTHLSVREQGDVAMEFVLVTPVREIASLEAIFPDLVRLSAVRDASWRSEAEATYLRRRRRIRQAVATEGDLANGEVT